MLTIKNRFNKIFIVFLLCLLGIVNRSSALDNTNIYADEINILLKDLDSESKDIRMNAIRRLAKIGSGEVVQRSLSGLLADKDKEVSAAAFSALQYISYRTLTNLYLKRARDKDTETRIQGMRALGLVRDVIYWDNSMIFDTLVNGLSDEHPLVREAALASVSVRRDERAIPYLINSLLSYKKENKIDFLKQIVNELVDIGKPTVPHLLKQLEDKGNTNILLIIIDILAEIREPVAKKLIDIYPAAGIDVKKGIIKALGRINKDPDMDILLTGLMDKEHNYEFLSKIVSLFRDRNIKLGEIGVDVLLAYLGISMDLNRDIISVLSSKGNDVVPYLAERFNSANIVIKIGIMETLKKINSMDAKNTMIEMAEGSYINKKMIVPYLTDVYDARLGTVFIDILKNEPSLRKYSVHWLKRFGKGYMADLIPLIEDEKDKEARLSALDILREIGDETLIQPLLSVVNKESDYIVKRKIILLLGGLKASDAIPYLIEEMGTHENALLETDEAVIALMRIGKPAVPYLIDLIAKDDKRSPRLAYILGKIGDKSAILPIKELLVRRPESGVFVYLPSNEPNSFSLKPVDAVQYSLNLLERGK